MLAVVGAADGRHAAAARHQQLVALARAVVGLRLRQHQRVQVQPGAASGHQTAGFFTFRPNLT